MAKKIIKLKVKITRDKGTHYHYPKGYDAKKIQVLGYGEGGEDFDHLVGVVEDKNAKQFLSLPNAKEITITEANTFVRKVRPQRMRITDEEKYFRSLKKKFPDLEGIEESKEFDVRDYL